MPQAIWLSALDQNRVHRSLIITCDAHDTSFHQDKPTTHSVCLDEA